MTQEVTSVRVRFKHLRGVRYCPDGTKAWFERHNLNWRDFVLGGIDGQVLLDSGDPMARKLVEAARNDHGK